jgi:hypothetical protein
MWLIFGVDSGFEARTDAFFIEADMSLTPASNVSGESSNFTNTDL